MSLPHDQLEELQSLLDQFSLDELTAEQAERLETLASSSPEACDLYIQWACVHASLRFCSVEPDESAVELPAETRSSLPPPTLVVDPQPSINPQSYFTDTAQGLPVNFLQSWPVAYLIGSVIFGLGLYVASLLTVTHHVYTAQSPSHSTLKPSASSQEYVGQITGIVNVKWSDESTAALDGARVSLGRKYALASGLMEISYDSGAKVILQGPVTYQVDSHDGGFLSVGRLTARLEKKGTEVRGQGTEKVASGQSSVDSDQWSVASETNLPSPASGRGARGEGGQQQNSDGKRNQPQPALTLALSQRERGPDTNPQSLIPSPLLSPIPRPQSPVAMFAVRTPSAIVTDLGTEFGVEAVDRETTHVHVFVGSVTVSDKNNDAVQLARAGQSVHVARGKVQHVKSGPAAHQFVRKILAPDLLHDDFNDNTLDPSKWTVNTAIPASQGNAEVVARNGCVELTNRGYLVTKCEFHPDRLGGIKITGRWTFHNNQDMLQILTRSDASPTRNEQGETAEGLEFFLMTPEHDGDSVFPQILCHGIGLTLNNMRMSDSLRVHRGDAFDFTIIDNGIFGVSFSLTQVGNPSNVSTISGALNFHNSSHQYVVFHNRESAVRGHYAASLDNVTISAPAKVEPMPKMPKKPPTLAAYWSFNGTTSDASGNKNNGSAVEINYLNDVPHALANRSAQSAAFNGERSNVHVPFSPSLHINDAMTIAFWMKADAAKQTGPYRRICSNLASNCRGWEIQQTDSSSMLSIRIDTGDAEQASLNQCRTIGLAFDGLWHHVAIAADSSGDIVTYFDGIPTTQSFVYGSGFGSMANLLFGNSMNEPSDWLKGCLADAAIWRGTLTDDQIAALANGKATPLDVVKYKTPTTREEGNAGKHP